MENKKEQEKLTPVIDYSKLKKRLMKESDYNACTLLYRTYNFSIKRFQLRN